jgi:hypothetical protein
VVWVRVIVPPGATSAVVSATEPVVAARGSGDALSVSTTPDHDGNGAILSTVVLDGTHGLLLLRLGESTVDGREPHLLEPLKWTTATGILDLALWDELGLADYSGAMTYSASIDVPRGRFESVRLELTDLVGSAVVRLDDVPAGAMLCDASLDLTGAVSAGVHRIDIEVANTLANFAMRLPSPFAGIQKPSGGFTAAKLLLQRGHGGIPEEGYVGSNAAVTFEQRAEA